MFHRLLLFSSCLALFFTLAHSDVSCGLKTDVFLSGVGTTFPWNTANLWNCSTPPNAIGSSAYIALPFNLTLIIDDRYSTNFKLGGLTIGASDKTPAQQVQALLLTGPVSVEITNLLVQQRGDLILDIGTMELKTSSFIVNADNLDIKYPPTIEWRSGTLSSAATASAPITLGTGSLLHLMGAGVKTLSRKAVTSDVVITDSALAISNSIMLTSLGNFKMEGTSSVTGSTSAILTLNGTVSFDKSSNSVSSLFLHSSFLRPLTIEGQVNLGVQPNLLDTLKITGEHGQLTLTNNSKLHSFDNSGIININGPITLDSGTTSTNSLVMNVNAKTISATTGVTTFVNDGTMNVGTSCTFGGINVANTKIIKISSGAVLTLSYLNMSLSPDALIQNTDTSATSGSMSVTGTLLLIQGIVRVPVSTGLKTASTIGSEATATSPLVLDWATLTLSASSQLAGAIKMDQSPDTYPIVGNPIPTIINKGSAVASSLTVDSAQSGIIGLIQNEGKLITSGTGLTVASATIDVINKGQIGSDFDMDTAFQATNLDLTGSLTLSPTSVVYLAYGDGVTSSISVKGNFTADGSLVVMLKGDYAPMDGTTITLIDASSSPSVDTGTVGKFASAVVNTTYFTTNRYGCNKYDIVPKDGKWTITFSCVKHTPVTIATLNSSTTGTIAAVVVVVFVVAVVIGVVAWCKKKYRKRPWDRLRRDRL